MKILVVGGGGREHAIIKKIKENPNVERIYALPGNGGIARDAECVNIGAKDIDAIVTFAYENRIDYAIVAPDDPLVAGCVDRLEEVGIPCFGPRANAAIIEGSKVFSKNLMKKYGIPTAKYEVFTDMDNALKYLETAPIPTVIKADGLALGKGVIIALTREEAKLAVISMMRDKQFEEAAGIIAGSGAFTEIALVSMQGSRALTSSELESVFAGSGARLSVYDSPAEALRAMLDKKGDKDVLFCAGSLYLAGDIIALTENGI